MRQKHGFGRYTNGCRCNVCREGKAEYMRRKRADAARRRDLSSALGGAYLVAGIAHGLAGYNDHCCRCEVCREAKSAVGRRESRRQ